MATQCAAGLLENASRDRVALFGTKIDPVTRDEAVLRVLEWIDQGPRYGDCRYVLTPNVDHVVKLQSNSKLRDAYADASLVVADGWPVVAASRMLGRRLPERVAGSDLVPEVFDNAPSHRNLRVFLMGGMPGVAERAADRVEAAWAHVEVVGVSAPPFGFEKRPEDCDHLCELVEKAEPDLLIIGFGAPKQELWLHAHRDRIRASATIAAGATIDFLAGEQTRAPQWVQSVGMEWFYRAASDPRRLAARYARDMVEFPRLCLLEALRVDRGGRLSD